MNDTFFNKLMFTFGNMPNVNSIFVNNIDSYENCDLELSENIRVEDNYLSLENNNISGIYYSTEISTFLDEESIINDLYLVTDEYNSNGSTMLYYILDCDNNDEKVIIPNNKVSLKLKDNCKKIRLKIILNPVGSISPSLMSFGIMYEDKKVFENMGLKEPNISVIT